MSYAFQVYVGVVLAGCARTLRVARILRARQSPVRDAVRDCHAPKSGARNDSSNGDCSAQARILRVTLRADRKLK